MTTIRKRYHTPLQNDMQQPLATTPPPAPRVSTRSDLGIFMHPGLVDPCSVSHVLRNLAIGLYQKAGVDVRWGESGTKWSKPLCASYLGTTEQFMGQHTQPYLSFTWDIELNHLLTASTLQRGIMVVATSDHSRIYNSEDMARLRDPRVKAIFALSPLCRETLIDAGAPEEKMHLLPLGVDRKIYRPDGPAYSGPAPKMLGDTAPAPGALRFLCAGYMQKRKGVVETVEAFCRAFRGRKDVCLVIKNVELNWGKDFRSSAGDVAAILSTCDDAPPVAYIGATLTEWEMAALLRGSYCIVNAHHREGFGLLPLQAMACGTPAIVTDYHGPTQYATVRNSYLIPVSGFAPDVGGTGGRRIPWATYDPDALADLMLQAVEGNGRQDMVDDGLRTAEEWSWERTVAAVVETVEENIGNLRRRPEKWSTPKVPVSVVMPVRNGAEKLAVTLSSLHVCCSPGEVLVYDDASGPVERQAIAELCAAYSDCRLVRGDKQVGCHGARAILFEEARGEFIASIDADLDFSGTAEDWMDTLMLLWDARGHGIMHPLLTWPMEPKVIRTVQSAGGMIGPANGAICQHRYEDAPVVAEGVGRSCRTAYCCGAFQFFHSGLLNEVAMDPRYFPAYFGDVDLCYRARAAGYPVWYCPEVRVTHDARSWTWGPEGKQQGSETETRALFLERWTDMADEDRKLQDETGALGYE